jgi:PilZ domain
MLGPGKEEGLHEKTISDGTSPVAADECRLRQADANAFVKKIGATPRGYSPVEKRSEPRVPTDDPASMHILSPLIDERFAIRVLDASKNGLKLSASIHLQPGMLVQVRIRNSIAIGEVRHCTKVGEEFHAGIRLDDVITHHAPGATLRSPQPN